VKIVLYVLNAEKPPRGYINIFLQNENIRRKKKGKTLGWNMEK